MKKIIVAPDSFKGSVTSAQAARAAANAIHSVFPECNVIEIPIADGGEGTTEALVSACGGGYIDISVHDPLMRLVDTRYGITDNGQTAVIEMAAASGPGLLTPAERDPMKTTSYGTGQMIFDAIRRKCRNIIIGLGGTATNDAGTGILSALGFRFTNKNGGYISNMDGSALTDIDSIEASSLSTIITETAFTLCYDVDAPFTGERGAARVFAPQKGAGAEAVETLEKGMRHLEDVVSAHCGKWLSGIPGSGAAGGAGGMLAVMLGAKTVSGIDLILEKADFDTAIKDADLIITGEGRMDAQTSMGKAPYGILRAARKYGIPVIAVTGEVSHDFDTGQSGFTAVFPVQPGPVSRETATDSANTLKNIERTVSQVMHAIKVVQ